MCGQNIKKECVGWEKVKNKQLKLFWEKMNRSN